MKLREIRDDNALLLLAEFNRLILPVLMTDIGNQKDSIDIEVSAEFYRWMATTLCTAYESASIPGCRFFRSVLDYIKLNNLIVTTQRKIEVNWVLS